MRGEGFDRAKLTFYIPATLRNPRHHQRGREDVPALSWAGWLLQLRDVEVEESEMPRSIEVQSRADELQGREHGVRKQR